MKYNACVTFCTFAFFLLSSTEKTTELVLTHDGSYDAVSCKEVPFGDYKIKIEHFNLFFSQKYEQQDNVHMNTESVRSISTVYSICPYTYNQRAV